MELDRLVDDAGARARAGVDLDVAVGERVRGVGEPEQPGELRVRVHGDQVAARLNPVAEHLRLGGGERLVAEDRHVVGVEHRRRNVREIGRGEFVQPLGAKDLGVVAAERVGGAGDHQDRAAGALVRRRGWRRRGRERPGVVGAERIPGRVTDPSGAALDRRRVLGRILERAVRVERHLPLCRAIADVRGNDRVRGIAKLNGGAVDRARVHRLVEGRRDVGAGGDATGAAAR